MQLAANITVTVSVDCMLLRELLVQLATLQRECQSVCVCHPCTKGLSNFAGGPRATGWLGPTKTHPVCCVNVPAKSCSWVTEWQLGNSTKFLSVMYMSVLCKCEVFSCVACFNRDSRIVECMSLEILDREMMTQQSSRSKYN